MTMSTNYQFNSATERMQDIQARIAKIQAQVASGERMTHPSDDADTVSAILRVESAITRQDHYAQTIATVQDRLKSEETALRNSSDLVTRLKELSLQASTATASPEDRANIALVMESVRQELLSLSATRDSDGHYLFSGTRAAMAPWSNDPNEPAAYAGDTTRVAVRVGDQGVAASNRSGLDAFDGVVRSGGQTTERVSFFRVVSDLITSVKRSDMQGMTRGIDEINSLGSGISRALTSNGSDQSDLSNQQSRIDETRLRLKTTLSGLKDTDYAEAISQLQKESLGLQAAQSTFAKTTELSLFNYIK
jgi:flagellar hook-associated protein 3 FlgL